MILATVTDYSKSLGIIDLKGNVDGWSKWIFGIYFAFMILGLILLILAAFTNNKPINGLAAWRIVVFGMGASTLWLIGSEMNNSYRGLNGRWLSWFYDRMHPEYWGLSIQIKIFNPVKNENGIEYPGYFHYFNRFIFEFCITLIARILAFVGTPMFTMLGHGIVTWFSGKLLLGFIWWWKQNYYIGLNNDQLNTGFSRKPFGYIMGWIFAVLAALIVLENVAMMFVSAKAAIMPDLGGDRKKAYQETGKDENGKQKSKELFFSSKT